MKGQEFLNRLQQEKQRQISRLLPNLVTIKYHTPEDEEDIQGWSDAIAMQVARQIASDLIRLDIKKSVVDGTICPWCIRICIENSGNYDCFECSYGLRHGICSGSEFSNDWRTLINHLFTAVEKKSYFGLYAFWDFEPMKALAHEFLQAHGQSIEHIGTLKTAIDAIIRTIAGRNYGITLTDAVNKEVCIKCHCKAEIFKGDDEFITWAQTGFCAHCQREFLKEDNNGLAF